MGVHGGPGARTRLLGGHPGSDAHELVPVYADDRVSEKPFHIDTRRTVSSRLTPAEVRFAKTLNPIPYTLHPRLSASVVEYGS